MSKYLVIKSAAHTKMAILHKLIYRLNILIKWPITFVAKIDKEILKFIWKWKGLKYQKNKQTKSLKKNKFEGLTF